MQFRKKPVVIDAIQWTGDNAEEVQAFLFNGHPFAADGWVKGEYVEIGTLEGLMIASIGDWIIRGVKGEHYPCKPDIFQATYEPALQPQQQVSELTSSTLGPIKIGNLPTMNQDDYPDLGNWWVQLRIGPDNDEVLARVYGDTPQQAYERAVLLADQKPQQIPEAYKAVPVEPEACEPVKGAIERLAINRYRPVPAGVFSYKVVAGNGSRSLFSGTKDECKIVAAKLTEAFLDGAHVAQQPAEPVKVPSDIELDDLAEVREKP